MSQDRLLAEIERVAADPLRFEPLSVWKVTAQALGRLNGQATDTVRVIRDTLWTPSEHPGLIVPGQHVCDNCGRPMKRLQFEDDLYHCAGNSTWWCDVVRHGREIVESYDTEVGLRQTHYRLMSNRSDYVNSRYNGLSSQTAMPRRIKTFPRLLDSTRQINRPLYWEDADDAKEWLKRQFRVDRTRNQDVAIYIALEKRGLIAQFDAWFSQPFGIPVIPLGGVSSESIERDTIEDVIRDATEHENRRRVLLAGGDFDASGEFIGQNYARFVGRYFDRIIRVTLTADQVEDLDLPVVPGSGVSETTGRCKNSLWPAFRDKYWDLLCQQSDRHPEVDWDPRTNPEHAGQVEMDALDPNYLRDLFQEAIYDAGWSDDAYQAALAEEEEEREDI